MYTMYVKRMFLFFCAIVFSSIYNTGSAQFKDQNLKANAWQQIAKYMMADAWVENKDELTSEVANCKQRYESIRTLEEQAPIESCHLCNL